MNKYERQSLINKQMDRLGYDKDLLQEVLNIDDKTIDKYMTGYIYKTELSFKTFLTYLEIDEGLFGYEKRRTDQTVKPLGLFKINKSRIKQLLREGISFFNSLFKKEKEPISEIYYSYVVDKDVRKPVLFKFVLIFLLVLLGIDLLLTQLLTVTPVLFSSIIPLVMLVYLYELEKKEIGLIKLLSCLVLGGLLSLSITFLVRLITGYPISLFGDLLTGLIEEGAKVIIVFFMLKFLRVKSLYVALLLGFAVGAGFDIFETAEYGIRSFLADNGSYIKMISTLLTRSIFALGIGHHFWTMTLSVILFTVRKYETIEFKALLNPQFLIAYLLVSAFHGLWNSDLLGIFYLVQLILGFILFVLVVDNVKQSLKVEEVLNNTDLVA